MNIRIYLLSFPAMLLLSIPAFSQVKKAKKEMSLYNYSEAISSLKKEVKSKDSATRREAILLMAECYRKQNDVEGMKAWYSQVVDLGKVDPLNYYYYAQALRSAGEYAKAGEMFARYAQAAPGDPRGKVYGAMCDSALSWKGRMPLYEIKITPELNSKESDFGTVFYLDDVIFTSDRPGKAVDDKVFGWTGNDYLKLYSAGCKYPGNYFNDFTGLKLFKEIFNEEYHDGPASFDRSGRTVFINRTLMAKDKGRVDSDKIRTHLLKLYYAEKDDKGKWSRPEPFFLNSNEYSVGHPALTPDGNMLYFTSDMPGGLGGTDIWSSKKVNGKWEAPVNLGPVINTPYNEMFPYISDKGDLYYSSTGLAGLGGLDIFVSHPDPAGWTVPENLGAPLNTSYDDFALAISKDNITGLFSSNRPGGAGMDDIYAFRTLPKPEPKPLPPPPVFLTGCVKDKTTLLPIPMATVFLMEDATGEVLILKSNQEGCFKTPVKKGTSYTVKAMKTGYISDCFPFGFAATEPANDLSTPRPLLLDQLAVARVFKIEDIYYDFDKWNIRPDAEPPLNTLVKIMNENPITVELGSHTDCRGSDAYNQVLSQKRAESAVNYIISKGISPSRITAKGYGESQPVNKCVNGVPCTAAEHQANRRTEFKVISTGTVASGNSFDPDRYKEGEKVAVHLLPEGFFENCK